MTHEEHHEPQEIRKKRKQLEREQELRKLMALSERLNHLLTTGKDNRSAQRAA